MNNNQKAAKFDIVERTFAYSLRIIRLYRELRKDCIGAILGKQLLRSGTSIGANVHESQGSQSKADFIAKVSIAHKEARESAYWLRLIEKAEIIRGARLSSLLDETDQLIRILSSILLTAKQRNEKQKERLGRKKNSL
ncbi:MAG TPA: four helix bundle protein [Acidobacteriota bacterium]